MKITTHDLSILETTINFVSLLVFKDESKAFEHETEESNIKASEYLAAFLKQDEYNDIEREAIIENYVEENAYYKQLQDDHGIMPALARLAKDFDIIKQPDILLQQHQYLLQYNEIYKKCLHMFYVTSYSPAMLYKPNYRELCLLSINLMAFLNLQSSWLERPYDLNILNEEWLDKFMYSFGVPFFKNLPLKYKQAISQNLNRLISNKGTNQVVLDILSIFKFDDVSINKYYLAKKVTVGDSIDSKTNTKNEVQFISHDIRIPSLSLAIRNNQYKTYPYELITHRDDHWQIEKHDIHNLKFDYVETKYFSIETGFDLSKEVVNTTLLLNLIKRIRSTYPTKGSLDVISSVINERIPAKIEDIIITLQALMCEFQGAEDIIQYDEVGMYKTLEFASTDLPILNTRLVRDIASINSVKQVELRNLSRVNKLDITSLEEHFSLNMAIKDNIERIMRSETNYWKHKKIRAAYNAKFYQNINLDIYNGHPTLTDYLSFNNTDLYNIIQDVRSIHDKEAKITAINNYILSLSDIIVEKLNNFNIFLGVSTTNILLDYIKRVISVFKAFTISLLDISIFIVVKDSDYKLFDEIRTKGKLNIDSYKNGIMLEDTIYTTAKPKLNDRIVVGEYVDMTKPMQIKMKDLQKLIDKYRITSLIPPYVIHVCPSDTYKLTTKTSANDRIVVSDRIVITRKNT